MDDLNIEEMHVKDGRIDMTLSGEDGKAFAIQLVNFLKDNDGINFFTITVTNEDKRYELTVRDCDGITPADKIGALEDELQKYKKSNTLKSVDEWHEDIGDALFWKLPIEESPFITSPIRSDWTENHYTHFTELVEPNIEGGKA